MNFKERVDFYLKYWKWELLPYFSRHSTVIKREVTESYHRIDLIKDYGQNVSLQIIVIAQDTNGFYETFATFGSIMLMDIAA